MENVKKCECGLIPGLVENNPSNFILLCECGKRTNGCNNGEHAKYCWNNGFVFNPFK